MITFPEAQQQIKSASDNLKLGSSDSELIPIEASIGRVLSEDVLCRESIPNFDNSSMDGFALTSATTRHATAGAPIKYLIAGQILAGEPAKVYLKSSDVEAFEFVAWEIMTGAPMPEPFGPWAFDAVVKVEDVKTEEIDGRLILKVPSAVAHQANVRKKGADYKEGQIVAKANEEITHEHLLAFAQTGQDKVRVYRKPTAVIISTGAELVHHSEQKLEKGKIRNSTTPYLVAQLEHAGVTVLEQRTVADDAQAFKEVFLKLMAHKPDIVITTGAVSMGKADFIEPTVRELGARIHFHKVAIKPGKPLLFASFKDSKTVLFGVPGNPVSSAVSFRFFLLPFIRHMMNMDYEKPVRASLENDVHKPEGLTCFFKAKFTTRGGHAGAKVLDGQDSFMISSLVRANAWAVLPAGSAKIEKGHKIEVYPLHALAHDYGGEQQEVQG